jgi:hypothetical protein
MIVANLKALNQTETQWKPQPVQSGVLPEVQTVEVPNRSQKISLRHIVLNEVLRLSDVTFVREVCTD